MKQIWILFALFCFCNGLNIELFPSDEVQVYMYESTYVYYNVSDEQPDVVPFDTGRIKVWSDDGNIATIEYNEVLMNDSFRGNFKLYGEYLGVTVVHVALDDVEMEPLHVRVIRRQRVIDKAFTASVAILVSLIYINFGCALNLSKLGGILRRPIGPCIGMIGQFLAMPLLSYALGLIFFPERPDMRLGLLFTGVSPAGGASNVWTCVLDGNIDLSVTMTTISTFASFGMMPLWLFTLGPHVFESAKIAVPYTHVASLAGALLLPLFIGCALQKWAPKVSNLLARALKGISACLILFIIIFGCVTNLHLFNLFTWRIIVAGLSLPLLGYIFGWIAAKVFRQSREDALAIAIETGIQNTGIAIFLLRFGLPQPQADLTTIVPVSCAAMTPAPLFLLWIYNKLIRPRFEHKGKMEIPSRPDTPIPEDGILPK